MTQFEWDRFRKALLLNHPDKHPGASVEELEALKAETRDILACWAILREYYHDQGQIDGVDTEEGYITMNVLKIFDLVTKQWTLARSWFGDESSIGRAIDPQHEKIEKVTLYV